LVDTGTDAFDFALFSAGCTLVDPRFIDCKWTVRGPAENTFSLLSALYKAGATDLIEATFNQIRGVSKAVDTK
jgi:hypothetical protein